MKIYLAASFHRRDELRVYRAQLQRIGHTVTSTWLDAEEVPEDAIASNADAARACLRDLANAEVIVCFTEPPTSVKNRGGRHVEAGFAYATGKTMLVVGPRENVFYCLPSFIVFDEWRQCLGAITARQW